MNMPFKPAPLARKKLSRARPPFDCIALLLQGGGALGAYQAGVYEALAEADLHPDWVAGISIGAINAAIIAGNAPEDRVDQAARVLGGDHRQSAAAAGASMPPTEFGEAMSRGSAPIQLSPRPIGDAARARQGFFAPRLPPPWLQPTGTAEAHELLRYLGAAKRRSSGWSTSTGSMPARCASASAPSMSRTGNFVYFDNDDARRSAPSTSWRAARCRPAFPPVEIEGEYYWDGGLVSNTPLQWVARQRPAAGHAGLPGRPVERARRLFRATSARSRRGRRRSNIPAARAPAPTSSSRCRNCATRSPSSSTKLPDD